MMKLAFHIFANLSLDPLADVFSMEGWPVDGPWRLEMMARRDSIELQPLVAYDGINEDARPLTPKEYLTRLPGSIVKVTASISCFKFGLHAMSIHIDELHICCPAIAIPASPSKKRFKAAASSKASECGSPTKKGRYA